MLAAYLQAEGWTVWWDTSLTVGDTFRDEIMKQLAAARAVIVLWTQNSIRSDFVRAEAGRAKADGKLIPVKERDVAYFDIPLPFGEMHTEELSRYELIRAAVVALLAKPRVRPSAFGLALRILRYHVLTWVGIVGGAITLFSNLRGVLTLTDWAGWFVAHWNDWVRAFWLWALGWLGITPGPGWRLDLTFALFLVLTSLGSRIEAIRAGDRSAPLGWPWFWQSFLSSGCGLLAYAALAWGLPQLVERGFISQESLPYATFVPLWGVLFLLVMHWPVTAALGTATVLEIFLLLMAVGIYSELEGVDVVALPLEIALFGLACFLAFFLAVPRRFHARLWFMLTGVLILMGLNAASRLGLNVGPPQ